MPKHCYVQSLSLYKNRDNNNYSFMPKMLLFARTKELPSRLENRSFELRKLRIDGRKLFLIERINPSLFRLNCIYICPLINAAKRINNNKFLSLIMIIVIVKIEVDFYLSRDTKIYLDTKDSFEFRGRSFSSSLIFSLLDLI